MFSKNTWYVAATPEEVTDKPLGRTICNEKIVFFRGQSGTVAAVEDFCPHRGAPLSLGFTNGDNIVCGYHGLAMGADGKTASMPQQRVERFPCNKAYPIAERYGYIWVWPGEPALADSDAIPQPAWADDSDWDVGVGMFHIHCDYRLMVDNLMDLSHETYVHRDSIGQEEIEQAPVKSYMEGDTVITHRLMEGITAPPFWQAAMKANGLDPEQTVDRWQICRFSLPSHIMIDVGVAVAGKGGYDAPPEYKAGGTVIDYLTPETDTSMWYFWGMARQFRTDDEPLTDQIRANQHKIFTEDLAMLEQQQQNLLRHPERRLLKLNIDSGGVLSRRAIDTMLAQEQEASP